jgi:hypothetical protein
MVLKHEMIPPEMNPISSYDPMHFAGQEALAVGPLTDR